MVVRPYTDSDRAWAEPLLDADFGGRVQARRGELIDVLALSGLVAEENTRPVGLLTYRCETGACEIAVPRGGGETPGHRERAPGCIASGGQGL